MTISSDAAVARAWLAEAARPRKSDLRRSGLLLAADAVAAIGFAAGLANAVCVFDRGLAALAPWLVLMVASAGLRAVGALFATTLAARAADDLKHEIRRGAVGVMFADARMGRGSSGEILAAAVDGVEALDGFFTRFLPSRQAATIAPLLIIAAVAVASPISAAILTGALVPFIAGMALAGMAAADEARRQFQALQRLSGLFVDRLRALPLIWSFDAAESQTLVLASRADDLRRRVGKVLGVAFLSSAVLEFFAALSVAMAAVYCGFNLLRLLPFPVPETLDLRRAIFVLALAPEVYAPLRRLAAAYHDRQAAEAAASSLAVIASPQAPAPRTASLAVPRAPTIRYCGVSVTYPDADGAAVSHLNLEVPGGAITALLGASGGGKSTVLNLLLGLAPLSEGEVWIGPLALSQAGDVAPSIAWAGQSPLLIPGSIADNIRLAAPGASSQDIARVAEAVGLAGALGLRPRGLDCVIDERGSGLSGGEARRITLARALLKPAPILLLDEPTANLDAAATRQLLPVILAAARGRTALIATHSEAVAAIADHVVRL